MEGGSPGLNTLSSPRKLKAEGEKGKPETVAGLRKGL